ncbi:dethiobiotin synthase, partial [Photobacterium damselae subsp. damselae]|nr:dethiobiotin synthase [Photobacterium damselae subsp. damselae]
MTKAFFVTGTDTEVGKTVATRAILHAAGHA